MVVVVPNLSVGFSEDVVKGVVYRTVDGKTVEVSACFIISDAGVVVVVSSNFVCVVLSGIVDLVEASVVYSSILCVVVSGRFDVVEVSGSVVLVVVSCDLVAVVVCGMFNVVVPIFVCCLADVLFDNIVVVIGVFVAVVVSGSVVLVIAV